MYSVLSNQYFALRTELQPSSTSPTPARTARQFRIRRARQPGAATTDLLTTHHSPLTPPEFPQPNCARQAFCAREFRRRETYITAYSYKVLSVHYLGQSGRL